MGTTWPDGTWCGEKLDERPRVHSCLNGWCNQKSDDCAGCDAVIESLRSQRKVAAPPSPVSPDATFSAGKDGRK